MRFKKGPKMHIINTQDPGFKDLFLRIRQRSENVSNTVERAVKDIITQIREHGDRALLKLTKKFDGHEQLTVPSGQIKASLKQIPPEVLASLKTACSRIADFHKRQRSDSWQHEGAWGETLGQIVRPLERVGIYVPGGKAAYPSSVLMNAIPARVAGVKEIIMATPCPGNQIPPVILAAAALCGIEKIFQIGGAQAIAALAYGTETVPAVDKIVGPGNIYVATAKKLVFGQVDIDMIAGPSEILIIADGSGSASWAAADMLSQAEHDELASAVLITPEQDFAYQVKAAVETQLITLPKKQIAQTSLDDYGAIIITRDIEEAVDLSNAFAPEHLELFMKEYKPVLPMIQNAGAIFAGIHTPEAVGDYIAGPNHVLPTGGTARFFSPLGVDDFIKKMSLVSFTEKALNAVSRDVLCLAGQEALIAHARSVEIRMKQTPRA